MFSSTFLILMLVITTDSLEFQCVNISSAISAFFSDPYNHSNIYVRSFEFGDHSTTDFPADPCYKDTMPLFLTLTKNLTDRFQDMKSEIGSCCYDLDPITTRLDAMNRRIEMLSSNLTRVVDTSFRTFVQTESQADEKNQIITSILDRVKALEHSGMLRARDVTNLLKASYEMLHSLEDLEVRLLAIEKAINNQTYYGTNLERHGNFGIFPEDNSDIANDSMADASIWHRTESVEQCFKGHFLIIFFSSALISEKIRGDDCKLLKELYFAVLISSLVSVLVIYLLYKLLKHLLAIIICNPIRKKYLIDSTVHSIVKKAKKTGRLSDLRGLVNKLKIHEVNNVQYSFPLSSVINMISERTGIYYVAALMTVELSVDPKKNFLQKIFRSIRYSDDFFCYMVVFGYFKQFLPQYSSPNPISKMTLMETNTSTPSYSIHNNWVIPMYGRIHDFLQDCSVMISRAVQNPHLGNRAVLNLGQGGTPDHFIHAFGSNDDMKFNCEGILIFKNVKLFHVILNCDINQNPEVPELQVSNIETLFSDHPSSGRAMKIISPDAPFEESRL